MKPGIYDGISNADYHGGAGVSKSMLDVLAERSPLHLHHLRTSANDNDRAPTPAQAIGTAFHALLLEPGEFVKDYCLGLRQSDFPGAVDGRDQLVAMVEELNKGRLPKLSTTGSKDDLVGRIMDVIATGDDAKDAECLADLKAMKGTELKAQLDALNEHRQGLLSTSGTIDQLAQVLRDNGKEITLWKDIKAEWLHNNGHRNVLEPEQWDQLHNMRDAVLAHPAARALLSVEGRAEQSVYWVDEATGELCRCRPDWWRVDGVVVDLKTTEDASLEGFAKSIGGWRYHVQHPFYLDGVNAALQQGGKPAWLKADKAKAFVFLAVEKNACVVNGQAKGVAVYVLNQDSVDLGRAEYRRDLQVYAECNRTGTWPGYGDKIQNISVPQWQLVRGGHLIAAA
jgi:exodeoxyribonuclease VIII